MLFRFLISFVTWKYIQFIKLYDLLSFICQGGFDYKKEIVECIISTIEENPEAKEAGKIYFLYSNDLIYNEITLPAEYFIDGWSIVCFDQVSLQKVRRIFKVGYQTSLLPYRNLHSLTNVKIRLACSLIGIYMLSLMSKIMMYFNTNHFKILLEKYMITQ